MQGTPAVIRARIRLLCGLSLQLARGPSVHTCMIVVASLLWAQLAVCCHESWTASRLQRHAIGVVVFPFSSFPREKTTSAVPMANS